MIKWLKNTLYFPFLALYSCSSVPALADTREDYKDARKALIVANALDLGTTIYGLQNHKGYELNPILGKYPKTWKLVAYKASTTALQLVLFDEIYKKNPKAAVTFTRVAVGLTAGVVVWNATIVF